MRRPVGNTKATRRPRTKDLEADFGGDRRFPLGNIDEALERQLWGRSKQPGMSMWHRMAHWILARRRQHFSKVFYERHHEHFVQSLRRMAWTLGITCVPAAGLFIGIVQGWGSTHIASVAMAVLMFVLLTLPLAIIDCFIVRVLPYFDRPVGGTDTFLTGRGLLWHSRKLDAIALRHGVRPLSEFASGDDLIPGEELRWFPCIEALLTVDCLLAHVGTECCSTKVIYDLTRLRAGLRLADAKGIRFCLLLREGSVTSGWEMSQRRGSFF